MAFYPDWLKENKNQNETRFKLLVVLLVLLGLFHFFFIYQKQGDLERLQNQLAGELQVNEMQIRGKGDLAQNLNELTESLNQKKALLGVENTQILIEAFGDLIRNNDGSNIQVSLVSETRPETRTPQDGIRSFSEQIAIMMQFNATNANRLKIVDAIIASPFMFSIEKINFGDATRANWLIQTPTDKTIGLALAQLTKQQIFPTMVEKSEAPILVVEEKKVEVTEAPRPTCSMPVLEGIVQQKDSRQSMVFINGEIYRLNQNINCYQITQIFAQKIQLTDERGQVFELFTTPE